MRNIHYSKRISILFISLLMLGTLQNTTVAANGVPDEQYVPSGPPNSTMIGVQFLNGLSVNLPGYLISHGRTPDTLDAQGFSTAETALCASIDDAICKASAAISYSAHLPNCLNALDVDCVSGIYAIKPDGTKVEGIFLRGIPEKPAHEFKGNSALGLPRSGVDGLWSLPGVLNGSGSDTYFVIVEQFGKKSKERDVSIAERIPTISFSAGIIPVKVISGSYKPADVAISKHPNGTNILIFKLPTGEGVEVCAGVSTTECARREAFPSDTVFGLSLRLSGELNGWLHGRIRDPLIDYKNSLGVTTIAVQAHPVSVPVVAGWTEKTNLPKILPGFDREISGGGLYFHTAGGENSLETLKLWLPLIGDKAQANPTFWQFGHGFHSIPLGANICIFDSKSLTGFISTNSTAYIGGPPLYNSNTGSLDYKLASPHFTSKGEVFKGTYNLTIRSDIARCIYKFTNAPIKATISVTDESGQSSFAVESMNERDGWIYLSVSGFTFSSPTVHVKLIGTPITEVSAAPVVTPTPTPSQTSTPTPTPTETATPSPTPTAIAKPVVKRSTITCVKGSLVKKITSMKPMCPKGYKKKSN